MYKLIHKYEIKMKNITTFFSVINSEKSFKIKNRIIQNNKKKESYIALQCSINQHCSQLPPRLLPLFCTSIDELSAGNKLNFPPVLKLRQKTVGMGLSFCLTNLPQLWLWNGFAAREIMLWLP